MKGYAGITFENVREGVEGALESQIKTLIMSGFWLSDLDLQSTFKRVENRKIDPLTWIKLSGNQIEIGHDTFNPTILENLEVLEVASCYLTEKKHSEILASYIAKFKKLKIIKFDHNKFEVEDLRRIF